MKKIALIVAMPEEMACLETLFSIESEEKVGAFTFQKARYGTYSLVLCVCGIGKVNAAMAVALIAERYHPDLIVNVGVSGALWEHLVIGDVLIASELRYHDVHALQFGYEHGQIPRMPSAYFSAEEIKKKLLAASLSVEFNRYEGLICSGDIFVSDAAIVKRIQDCFKGVAALDMESCGVAQACYQLNLPLCVIRGISDAANHDAPTAYEEALPLAMQNVRVVFEALF